MKRSKEIFWGLLLILGAVFIVVNRMGYLRNIGIFTVVFTIFLVGILIENVIQRSIGGVLFSLAFLGILYDEFLGIESLTPVPILAAALLGTIGCNMIFGKRRHGKGHHNDWQERSDWKERGEVVDVEDDGQVQCFVSFHETTKYVNSSHLCHADLSSSFGSLGVYFDQAVLEGGKASVDVSVSFGNMELYVPGEWQVILNVDTVFGGVDERGKYRSSKAENTLSISGSVRFGALEIHYI